MSQSEERLRFINEIMKAITFDHNQLNSVGLEKNRFFRGNFENRLEVAYPRVGTSELLSTAKKAVKALDANPAINKGMDEDKVEGLMYFVFKDHDASRWPTVLELVKNYAGGVFAHYADNVMTQEKKESEKIKGLLAGMPEDSVFLQDLRVYVEKTIEEHKRTQEEMEEHKKIGQQYKEKEEATRLRLEALYKSLSQKENLTVSDRAALETFKILLSDKAK
jgi:hypothetical protein